MLAVSSMASLRLFCTKRLLQSSVSSTSQCSPGNALPHCLVTTPVTSRSSVSRRCFNTLQIDWVCLYRGWNPQKCSVRLGMIHVLRCGPTM